MRSISQAVVLVMAVTVAMPALALTTPQEPWDTSSSSDELNLFEVYNAVYGTAYTSNADLTPFQVDQETFNLGLAENMSINAEARYAGSTEHFGWYEDTGAGVSETELFHVTDYGLVNGYSATISPAGDFGFWLTAEGRRAHGNHWFSEDARNGGDEHFLIYATPIAGQYFLAWEDLALYTSDLDYQDLVLTLQFGPVIPEPATVLLFGVGMAGMLAARMRSRKA